MTLFIISLIVFLVLHSIRIVAPQWRQRMITTLGQKTWRGVYSLASLASLALLIYAFGASRASTPMLYYPLAWMSHITLLLMLISMILLVVSICPAGHISVRIKHPLLTAVKTWALAHLLANGEANSVLLFAGFLAWAVIARISAKRQGVQPRPFVAAKWDAVAVVGGILFYLVFTFYLHEILIGVSPMAMAGV